MPSFDVPTTLAPKLAQAATDRGILLGPDPDHSILVAAHHAHWRIHEDPKDLVGWCATRVDAAHRDIPPVTGWLGPRDLKPDRILDNLLAQRHLPTDMSGRQPWVSTRHPWAAASDYLYARCHQPVDRGTSNDSGCGLTGPAQLVSCTTADGARIDLRNPCLVRCRICRSVFDGRLQAVPPNTTSRCPRCPALLSVPEEATHLCCHACKFRFFAPGVPTAYLTKLQRLMVTDTDDNVVKAIFGHPRQPASCTQ